MEARDALAQAAALDPANFGRTLLSRSRAGRHERLRGRGAQASRRGPNQPATPLRAFSARYALEVAGDLDAAMKAYQELISLDEKSAFGQLGLGALLVSRARPTRPSPPSSALSSLDPDHFEAHWALGRALALAKRYPEAVEAFERAVPSRRSVPTAIYQLGLALQRVGRADEAKRELDAAARITTAFRTGTTRKAKVKRQRAKGKRGRVKRGGEEEARGEGSA